MNKFKVFTSDEMSNEEYHNEDSWTAEYVSGSSLADIHATCPAAWKFKKKSDSKALEFGTQSHTNFESKELFESTYRRATNPDEVEGLITSQTALGAKLRAFGIKVTSTMGYPELLRLAANSGENLQIKWLIEMIEESQALADGVKLVDAKSYDACVAMRQVLESIPEYNACMNSKTAQRELSIFGEISGVKVKVRLDHVDVVENVTIEQIPYDEAVVITDYKTTVSANPSEFGRLCVNHGYLLKMALQHDLFRRAYPEEKRPIVVRLLAQEKKEPYIPMAFRLKPEHLKIGRLQYMSVINTFAMCKKTDVWPSYANGEPEVELDVPDWFINQFKNFI